MLLGRGEPAIDKELPAGAGLGEGGFKFLRCERAGAVEFTHADEDLVVGFLRDLFQFNVLAERVDFAAEGGEMGVGRAVVARGQEDIAAEEGLFDENELLQLARMILGEATNFIQRLFDVLAREGGLRLRDERHARIGLGHGFG